MFFAQLLVVSVYAVIVGALESAGLPEFWAWVCIIGHLITMPVAE